MMYGLVFVHFQNFQKGGGQVAHALFYGGNAVTSDMLAVRLWKRNREKKRGREQELMGEPHVKHQQRQLLPLGVVACL